MKVVIKSRNGRVSENQRAFIEQKLHKLERYLDGIGDVTVDLNKALLRGVGEVHIAQVTLHTPQGTILRAEERDADLYKAVDTLHDALQRQVTRYKERHYRRGKLRRQGGQLIDSNAVADETADNSQPDEPAGAEPRHIVRTKTFEYKPMYSDEAIEQMELLGHAFYVFTDADTNNVSVVYRRQDGNYGLIVPAD